MKMQEVHAVKEQLQQLNLEVRKFKKEILIERAEELEQAIRGSEAGSRLAKCDIVGGAPLPVKF